jgi:integrase
MQKGTIKLVGKCWMLRYKEPVIGPGGKPVIRCSAKKLATYSREYRTEESVRPLADLILAPINAKTVRPSSTQTVRDFLEHVYLPHIKGTKRPSTYKSYLLSFRSAKQHLDGHELREFRTSHVDKLMAAVAAEKMRAHTTHRNLKSFLSGAFRYAKRNDLIAENPVRDSLVPRGKPAGDSYAYSLDEIEAMLKVLPEPGRTGLIVAAFTGLRIAEVKGLRWDDVVGDELHVNRSVWSGVVNDTKTLTSKAPVPLLLIVKKALAAHRRRFPSVAGWVFESGTGKPLRLENELRRHMKPALKKAKIEWHGWHACRRGLGTNLNSLGVDGKTIQAILRHSDLSTTMAFYVRPVPAESKAAMRKIERAFRKAR